MIARNRHAFLLRPRENSSAVRGALMMRIAAPTFGPYPLVGLRLGLGAVVAFFLLCGWHGGSFRSVVIP